MTKAILIISVDIDAGSKELGIINRGRNDRNVSRYLTEYEVGSIEESALPMLLDVLDEFEVPATLAVRGQLREVRKSVLRSLQKTRVKHEIAAHGYSHVRFDAVTRAQAEKEMKMTSVAFEELGIVPRSFIFPCNSVAHLDLLEKYGYKCYRGGGTFTKDAMFIEKEGQLYNIHPSLSIDKYTKYAFLARLIDLAIAKKLPFHVWFHLWNFGSREMSLQKNIDGVLRPFLVYVKRKERTGLIGLETMFSAVRRVESTSSK